uniref:RNA-directed RNA polymerase n=1 Tax=Hebei mivirus 3 TaxID=2839029 RepID=A0A8G0QWI3_9VIRU|nr:MAG: RNA-dependent RNA polymerase [Hebei mivirus 3]
MEFSQRRVEFSASDLVYERKFDVALRKSHAEAVLRRLEKNAPSKDDQFLLAAVKSRASTPPWHDWLPNHHCLPSIVLAVVQHEELCSPTSRFKRVSRLASSVLEQQIHWCQSGQVKELQVDTSPYLDYVRSSLGRCSILHALLQLKEQLDTLVSALASSSSPKKRDESEEDWITRVASKCIWSWKLIGLSIAWSQHSALIIWEDAAYLVQRAYILLLHNKVCDIISVLLYACVCPDIVYGGPLLAITEDFIRTWAQLAAKHQQRFFHISKLLEGLVIGETLVELEGAGNNAFLATISDTLLSSARFRYEGSKLCQILRSAPTPIRHELGCLSKIMGHPFCDVELGAKRLHDKVTERKFIDMDAVIQCTRYAKEDFIRKFLAREGRWPLVDFDPGTPRALLAACMSNLDPRSVAVTRRFGTIRISDYDFVTILPNLKFDWVENFLPYVKDRTVTISRSDTVRRYLEKDPNYGTDWKRTRLLLFYLLWPETATDHIKYMEAYVRGDWRQVANYLVIRIVPKEKEHKIEARGFGCKTPQDRARSIVQELNVARFLDKYSDEHVMTLDEISVAKKLLGFRRLKHAYRGYRMVIISVDASSWNNRFRSASVEPVASAVLDAVYDTRIFSKTHEAYQRSLVYVPDADDVYFWDGQEGGIEGLNQDTWVFTYIHQMKVCMEHHPYPYYILCKGDDLRIAVMIPPEALAQESIDDLKTRLLMDVSTIGDKFGHVIKVEDSYASECYFAYSKNAYVSDVEQPQAFRKVQKCYGANNAFLTTPDDYVAGAMSNAHSASKTSPSPIACYAVALFWSYELLITHSEYKDLSDVQLTALLQVPNLIGGFPVIYLHNFFVRAESDLLPPFLHLVRFLDTYYPEVAREIKNVFKQKLVPPEKCLAELLVDPYSLPVGRPSPASALLRSEAAKLIKSRTRNKYIKQLFRMADRRFEQELVSILLTANVYNARLMSCLYACTPEGIIRELVRKFETGRSIYNALFLNRGRRVANAIVYRCAKADKKVHQYRHQLITKGIPRGTDLFDDIHAIHCPYRQAQLLRSMLWGKEVEAVTHPPLQHQLVVGEPQHLGSSKHVSENHFEVWVEPPADSLEAPLFTIGTREPFVGATTGRGLAPPEATLASHNVIAAKVKTLMDVYKWSHMTSIIDGELVASNLPRLAEQLLEAYTGKTIDHLMPFAGKKVLTRVTQHHARTNTFRASIVPNTLLNLYTRVSGNSRSHRTCEASHAHYRINYLHVFCHTVSLIGLPLWLGTHMHPATRYWVVTNPCQDCWVPIKETAVVLQDTTLPEIQLPERSYLAESAISDIRAELEEFNPAQYYVPDDDSDNLSLEEAQLGMIQGITNKIWRDRRKLQTLYTSHHMTHEGLASFRNWTSAGTGEYVNARDLRRLPMSTFLRDISFLVFTEIIHRLDASSIMDLSTALGNIPGEEMPWLIVLEQLDDSGRFYEVQREVHKLLPHMRCCYQDNPRSYAPLFGVACYQIMATMRPDVRIMQLSHLADPSVRRDIIMRIWGLRWSCLDRAYHQLVPTMNDPNHPFHRDALGSFCCGILTDDDELRFDVDPEVQSRITTRLFTHPDDPLEYLEAFIVESDDQEEPSSSGTAREVLDLPEFIHLTLRKFEMTASTLLHTIREIWGLEGEYERLLQVFLREISVTEVTIIRSDLVTCVNRVREQPSSERDDPFLLASHLGVAMPRVELSTGRRVTLARRLVASGAPYDATHGPESYSVDVTWEETLFNERWKKRPLGMGNISMSKAAYLFHACGIDKLPDMSTVACLGDGYGGFSAVCCALLQHGHIVYNTFPNRIGSHPEPVTALSVASQRGNTIDQRALDEGHYDLTLPATMEAIERSLGPIALVTLDAELKDFQVPGRIAMLSHTCQLFLRRGVPGSILFMKVYIHELINWMGVLGLLIGQCSSLHIVQSEASAMDGEVFVVAQLASSSADAVYRSVRSFPAIPDIRKIRHFCERYVRDMTQDCGGCRLLSLSCTFPPVVRALINVLPIYGWSKLQEVCRLVIPSNVQARQGQPRSLWLARVETFLERCRDQCIHELRGELPDRQSHLYNTLRHALVILDRYVRIGGFLHVVQLALAEHPLTEAAYEQAYRDAILRVPASLGLHRTMTEQLRGPVETHGLTTHPIRGWKLGCRWAVSGLSASDCI